MVDTSTAARLFVQYIQRIGTGESLEFDAFCQEHPAHADELRKLERNWDSIRRILENLGPAGSLSERIKSKYGSEANPDITLDEEGSSSDLATKLIERLSSRGEGYGRYKLKGEIDRGGQGAVLRVWDEDLRRNLAMKIMLGQVDVEPTDDPPPMDSKSLGRFLEEAQVTGQLDHPGIVPVHELGLDAEGRVYFTMKLVKGDSLSRIFDKVKSGEDGWTQTRALGVLLKVCEAMAYAHDKGVIHRDLKPANIMVGKFGETYVMDWGLARVMGKEDRKDIRIKPMVTTTEFFSERREHGDTPDSPLITMDGDVVGTPAYMSPEQARGQLENMGPWSDVYSVGAILYELLVGHMPYVKPGSRVNNHAVWCRVQEGGPEALDLLSPHSRPELRAICDRAMSRQITSRYPALKDLAEDLRAFMEERVVRAYETGAWAEARKWILRNRPLAASLAAALILALGGLIATGYVQARGRAAADLERQRADLKAEEVLSLSALQELEDLIAEAQGLWPAHHFLSPRFEDWIRRARELVGEAQGHEAKLAQFDVAADSREERWWVTQLTKLVGGLRQLETGLLGEDTVVVSHGWSVPKRLAHARRLEGSFGPGGEYAARWTEALAEIHEDYGGLELTPQLGLVPIGRDAESGLWEFWHIGSGKEPRRDADTLLLEKESGLVFILIPGADFQMGADSRVDRYALPNEAPVHTVSLTPYFISKFEMSQAQWERLAGENPSEFCGGQEHAGVMHTLLHPVESVSWVQCRQILTRIELELPTEAQWEFAARAGTTTPWWTGARFDSLVDNVNLIDQSIVRAGMKWPHISVYPALEDGHVFHAPVDSFSPNPFGLHHVIGNVWEWCADPFSDYAEPVRPGTGERAESASKQRVVRGGSFRFDPTTARNTLRFDISPEAHDNAVGVRPARAVFP